MTLSAGVDTTIVTVDVEENWRHYAIDTVILTRAQNKVLLTLTERKYRTEDPRASDGKTEQAVNDELVGPQKSNDFKSLIPDTAKQ